MALRLNTQIISEILKCAGDNWKAAQKPLEHKHLRRGLSSSEYSLLYIDYQEKTREQLDKLNAYIDDLRMLLAQFKTVEQLEDEWPEIAPLLKGIPRDFRQFKLVFPDTK